MSRREGPLLAAVFLGGIVGLGLLIYVVAATNGLTRGLAVALLGLGFLAARREVAHVLTRLSWPRWYGWNLAVTALLGVVLGAMGFSEIASS